MKIKEVKLVGILGKSGSGKDKFYWEFLSKEGFRRLALGDAVRSLSLVYFLKSYPNVLENQNELLRIFPSIYFELNRLDKNSFVRTHLQYIGAEVGRNFQEDYWVKIVEKQIEELLSKGIKVAITDIRYKNEAKMVKDFGGLLVFVEGQGRYDAESLESQHSSETELEEIEFDLTSEQFKRFYTI